MPDADVSVEEAADPTRELELPLKAAEKQIELLKGQLREALDDGITEEDRKRIASYLGVPADDPVLHAYVAVCDEHGFGYFSGKVWIEEESLPGKNGSEGEIRRKPAMGRDAFLDIAERAEGYEGMVFDTVCENDDFEKSANGRDVEVIHSIAKGEDETRGKVIGAYCLVFREGRPDTYFFAPLDEYMRTDAEGNPSGFWEYLSAMIIKCAQSAALRFAFGITGVVPADEKRFGNVDSEAEVERRETPYQYFERISDQLGTKRIPLLALIQKANEEVPNSWSLAKLMMRLEGDPSEETASRIIDEINEEIAAREKKAETAPTS